VQFEIFQTNLSLDRQRKIVPKSKLTGRQKWLQKFYVQPLKARKIAGSDAKKGNVLMGVRRVAVLRSGKDWGMFP
jgi:hypothetical protein